MEFYALNNAANLVKYCKVPSLDIMEHIGNGRGYISVEGSHVSLKVYQGHETRGSIISSNVGCAGHGCDHYYESISVPVYSNIGLGYELSSAIRCYLAVCNLNIAEAKACLNRVFNDLSCSEKDKANIYWILSQMAQMEQRNFHDLNELTKFFMSRNQRYYSHNYQEQINGLTLKDLRYNYSSSRLLNGKIIKKLMN